MENQDSVNQLNESGEYRILKKLDLNQTYNEDDGSDKKIAIFLDTETTGTNVEEDQIIELGMVAFEYNPNSGKIFRILREFNELEEPSIDIPEEATQVHGITIEMLKGKKINDNDVKEYIDDAVIILAHNAPFDRQMVEKRFPFFKDKHWGCSMRDVSWKENGHKIRILEFLAYKYGYFFEGHRATIDCFAAIHLLSKKLPESGLLVLKDLIDNARQSTNRIVATDAHISIKDKLKAHGYEWNPKARIWYLDARENTTESELEWLLKNHSIEGKVIASFGAIKRHSNRV